MELKEAMEVATENLDVRPGFVGDVMAGARRRHTRRLVAITAAVALLAGVTTGVVLTRSSTSPTAASPKSADARLWSATGGDMAGRTEFIKQSLAAWNQKTKTVDSVTEVSSDAHVFWAGGSMSGPLALVVQSVRIRDSQDAQTLVGLVHDGVVTGQELVLKGDREEGLYRFGADQSMYVVLGLGRNIYWSKNPVRGPDHRYTRSWWQVVLNDGVAVVKATTAERPVFVRADTAPPEAGFIGNEYRLVPRGEAGSQKPLAPRPGLGWSNTMWATARQEPARPGSNQDKLVSEDLLRRGLMDYGATFIQWEVRAWLPDGRFAVVTETEGELLGGLYRADGTFDRALIGGLGAKGTPVPVRLVLPDGQGTILADRGALLGPEERADAWLAPPGTTEVAVLRGDTTVVPL